MAFTGKSVVVTGASSGIGRALALRLASQGAQLTLGARNGEALEEVAAACRELGGAVQAVGTDVTDPVACAHLMESALRAYGSIDVLVNNAGLSMWARFDEVTDLSVFERLMRVNYLGAVYCTHHALPALRDSSGLIVAVSSLTGKTGVPARSGYAASKHAVQGFFDSLRVELRNTGVDVLVVSPGFVATETRSRSLGPDGQPRGVSPRDEGRGTMTVDRCVQIMVKAMERRRREVVMTPLAKLGQWLRLVAPAAIDRIAARVIGDPGR